MDRLIDAAQQVANNAIATYAETTYATNHWIAGTVVLFAAVIGGTFAAIMRWA